MSDELLAVRSISKSYRRSVLRHVSLTLARARTLAVVGPSGSGKSTLARCIAGFEEPDSGAVAFIHNTRGVQLIFQQPASSLNPRFTAAEIIEEPLVIQRRDRKGAAARAMQLVGLPVDSLGKRALQFSGGERQRLAIARALVLEPDLLILDESFAGLDYQLQNQIANLLRDLQERLDLAYILISHDLELIAGLSHDLAVMEEGAIVEHGPTQEILAAPRHPLTRRLVEAARVLSLDGAQ